MINKYVRWAAKRIAQYMGRGRDIVAFDEDEFYRNHPSTDYEKKLNQRLWDLRSMPEYDKSAEHGFTDEDEHGSPKAQDRMYSTNYGLTPDSLMEYVVSSSGLVEGIYQVAVKVASAMEEELNKVSQLGKREKQKYVEDIPNLEQNVSGFKQQSSGRLEKQRSFLDGLLKKEKPIKEKFQTTKEKVELENIATDHEIRTLQESLDKLTDEKEKFEVRTGIKYVNNTDHLSKSDASKYDRMTSEIEILKKKIARLQDTKDKRINSLKSLRADYEAIHAEVVEAQNLLYKFQEHNEFLSGQSVSTTDNYIALLADAFHDFSDFVSNSSGCKSVILKFLLNNAQNIFGSLGKSTIDANNDPEELMRSMATSLSSFVQNGLAESGKGLDSISQHMLYIARGGSANNFDSVATFLEYVRLMLRDAVKAVRRDSKKLPKNLRGPTEHDEGTDRVVLDPLDTVPVDQASPANYATTRLESLFHDDENFWEKFWYGMRNVIWDYYGQSTALKPYILEYLITKGQGQEAVLDDKHTFDLGKEFYDKLALERDKNPVLKRELVYKRNTKQHNAGDDMGMAEVQQYVNHMLKPSIIRDIPKIISLVLKGLSAQYPELADLINDSEFKKAWGRLQNERSRSGKGLQDPETAKREQERYNRMWHQNEYRKQHYGIEKTSSVSIETELKRVAELLADL